MPAPVRIGLIAGTLTVVAACGDTVAPNPATLPTSAALAKGGNPKATSKIVFTSSRDGNVEVYLMNADGNGQTRLTSNAGTDYNISVSADGSRIVFQSNMDGDDDIYMLNGDGTGLTNLTADNTTADIYPQLSPDGSKIAFVSVRNGTAELFTANASAGSSATLVSSLIMHPSFGGSYQSHWSPNSQQLAFAPFNGNQRDLAVVNADGSGFTWLTNTTSAEEAGPVWSPDGTRIAYLSDRFGSWDIFTIAPNGTGELRLTTDAERDWQPSWSPDGTRIAFVAYRDHASGEIYTMNADGSSQRRLTSNIFGDDTPAWSLDGRQIAFNTNRDGNGEIYIMSTNGAAQKNLTKNSGPDGGPVWKR